MSLPYISVPDVNLEAVGLGVVPLFSIFVFLSVATFLWSFAFFCRHGGDIRPRTCSTLMVVLVVGGYVGSFWGQVLFYNPEWMKDDPLILLKIWRGGYSSMTGFYMWFLAGFLYIRFKKEPFIPYLDRALMAMALTWGVARTVCAMIHDHPGVLTNFFLGVRFPDGVRHDLGLYEWLFQWFVIIPILFWITRKEWRTGQVTAVMLILYALSRFGFDFLRIGDPRWGGLTLAQYGCVGMLVFGIFVGWKTARQPSALQPSLWRKPKNFTSIK